MSYVLTDIGEEHVAKNGLQVAFDFGIYDDDIDGVTETTDIAGITTEPAGSNYARQSVTPGAAETGNYSGDWGFQTTVTFDTSDSAQGSIDGTFGVVNFDSEEAGDAGTPTDHLHHTAGPFSQQRDLSSVDTLNVTITVTVS